MSRIKDPDKTPHNSHVMATIHSGKEDSLLTNGAENTVYAHMEE